MGKENHRFFSSNIYQNSVLVLSVVPTLIFCVFATLVFVTIGQTMRPLIVENVAAVALFDQGIIWTVTIIWVFFVANVVWSFFISSRLLGPFGRILTDLDKVLAKEKKGPIQVRSEDYLADQLMDRINVLIKHADLPDEDIRVG